MRSWLMHGVWFLLGLWCGGTVMALYILQRVGRVKREWSANQGRGA